MRQFRDAAGVEWLVYRADPQQNLGLREEFLPESYRQGWLVFESTTEKRRLAPVPEGWQSLTPQELRRLLEGAVPTRPRRYVRIEAPMPPSPTSTPESTSPPPPR